MGPWGGRWSLCARRPGSSCRVGWRRRRPSSRRGRARCRRPCAWLRARSSWDRWAGVGRGSSGWAVAGLRSLRATSVEAAGGVGLGRWRLVAPLRVVVPGVGVAPGLGGGPCFFPLLVAGVGLELSLDGFEEVVGVVLVGVVDRMKGVGGVGLLVVVVVIGPGPGVGSCFFPLLVGGVEVALCCEGFVQLVGVVLVGLVERIADAVGEGLFVLVLLVLLVSPSSPSS